MKKITSLSIVILILAFALPEKKKIKIFMAGDSTMSIKETKAYPETGWGMPFVYFWDSTVTVINKAKNGRSTKSFINEGLWKSIMDEASEGDYVFIEFGHNDEVPTKANYTTESEFKTNLNRFIDEAKVKKMIPVLLTPVARRKFDSTGTLQETHLVYSQLVREVAAVQHVLFIDMDRKSQQLLQQLGAENSKLLFLQLKPGEHPNYPDGKDDNTHFNELGARLMAQIVLKEVASLDPSLAEHIIKSAIKK